MIGIWLVKGFSADGGCRFSDHLAQRLPGAQRRVANQADRADSGADSVAVAIPVVMPEPKPTPTPSRSAGAEPDAHSGDADPRARAPADRRLLQAAAEQQPDAPCSMQSPSFLGSVDKAITLLTQQQPSIFDFNQKTCENCFLVKDQSAFVSGVIKNLNAAGYCAYYDGEELAVKNSNAFNDQYDILVSSGHIRRGARIVPEHLQPVVVLSRSARG